MPMTLSGDGTITGLSAGGLPDSSIITADIADANITAAKLDGAQSGSAPIYAARAWVNFNGTGTIAIRASGNVSSITDNGTGNYTVNFTTAMPDANYSVVSSQQFDQSNTSSGNTATCIYRAAGALSSLACRINTIQSSLGTAVDPLVVTAAIFR